MAQTTKAVKIPSPNLHVNAQDIQSRGAPSDLGTLDRLDSPGVESSVSHFPRPTDHAQLDLTASHDSNRRRTNSNLSPPQQHGEWTQGKTSQEGQERTSISRPGSNSNRYYAEARERSGTVNSNTQQDQVHERSGSQNITTGAVSPPQPARTFYEPQHPNYPQGPAPAYSSPPQQSAAHFSPQSPPTNVQPDANPVTPPRQEAAMVTPLEHLNEKPALIDCPRCQTQTQTVVAKEAGDAVTLWAVVLCCLTGVLCAWIPCVMDDCKDSVHRCSQCSLLLATVTSSGAVRIAQGVSKPVVSQYQQRQQMQAPQGEKPGEQQWPPQARDAGPAPASWEQGEAGGKGYDERPQPYRDAPGQARDEHGFTISQEAASVPVAEMEDTSDPVELPVAMGAGWLGESSTSPTDEKKGGEVKGVQRAESRGQNEKRGGG